MNRCMSQILVILYNALIIVSEFYARSISGTPVGFLKENSNKSRKINKTLILVTFLIFQVQINE